MLTVGLCILIVGPMNWGPFSFLARSRFAGPLRSVSSAFKAPAIRESRAARPPYTIPYSLTLNVVSVNVDVGVVHDERARPLASSRPFIIFHRGYNTIRRP
ncbi:hypothetical protein DFH09DRAFT_1300234 [Mycena vulgaris]|nr:hypothetical protein DFH09DRAFT_1300234 [Mycena vulgaris]